MNKMRHLLYLALLIAAWPAQAQWLDFAQLTPTPYIQKNVNFSLGAVTMSGPKYTGSDERRATAYPAFDAQWKNGVFVSAISGLGYNFSKDSNLQYGVRMTMELGRDDARSLRLNGLGDIDSSLEPGAFLNYFINSNYALLSSVRYGSGNDHNGLQVSFGGRASNMLTPKHRITALFSTNWANNHYQQTYFGVNPTQAMNSGYSQYTPNSGLTDVKLGANWHWSIDTHWSLTTGASIQHLMGDAGNSPFIFQKTPVTIYSAASYRF
jgi:outer membrane protein